MTKVILFTDLDGTLLDDETYSATLSSKAVEDLQRIGVSIVFCSSKTRREQEVIRSLLHLDDPFIVENGSAICMPSGIDGTLDHSYVDKDPVGQALILGMPIRELRAILRKVSGATGVAYRSFHDMSINEIAQMTELSLWQAELAKDREYSETIVTKFDEPQMELFVEACESEGLSCSIGGRFLTVTKQGADKGTAVKLLMQIYQARFGNIATIGVGDSQNDEPMLRVVDSAYLVQRPNGTWRDLDVANLQLIPAVGPLGFQAVANEITRRFA